MLYRVKCIWLVWAWPDPLGTSVYQSCSGGMQLTARIIGYNKPQLTAAISLLQLELQGRLSSPRLSKTEDQESYLNCTFDQANAAEAFTGSWSLHCLSLTVMIMAEPAKSVDPAWWFC